MENDWLTFENYFCPICLCWSKSQTFLWNDDVIEVRTNKHVSYTRELTSGFTPQLSNQNSVYIRYCNLIGHFSKSSTKLQTIWILYATTSYITCALSYEVGRHNRFCMAYKCSYDTQPY
jgi:hypothetical protein